MKPAFPLIGALALVLVLLAGPPSRSADLQPHHDATVTFEPTSRELTVRDRISIAPTPELTVRLAAWMRIKKAESQGTPLAVSEANGLWQISAPEGSIETVTLIAQGVVPPMPPTDQRRRSRGPVADPEEGSFLPGYYAWMPDTGSDEVTYRLDVTVIGSQRAVATGRILAEKQGETGMEATFAADYPTELPSLFIGPYQVSEQTINGIRLRTYFHADIAPFAEHYISQSSAYIELFAKEIGPYPFDDFHIVSAPLPVGLGFPNMTYIGRQIVPLPFMRGRSLAHEVLHNWWGNGVAVDYASGNWSEGLTTYFADYGLARQQGADAAREMRLSWLRDYAALPAADDTPVSAFVSKTHQASQVIGYNKVAHVFHMLRSEIGEDAFTQGIRAFWTAHRFKQAGWSDIQSAFEQASARNLDWFFAQWIAAPGAPELELGDISARQEQGLHKLSVSLRQNGTPYRLSVPIVVETEDGLVHKGVTLSSAQETVQISLTSTPLKVSIDPDFDVFRRLLPGESPPIMRDISLAQSIDAVLLGNDAQFKSSATALINRLSGKAGITPEAQPSGTTIAVGTDEEIRRYAAAHLAQDLPPLVLDGTAAAWTHRTADGHAVLLVRAKDTASLDALLRPLPHYGSRSYVTFEGRRAQEKGVWKQQESPLSRVIAAQN